MHKYTIPPATLAAMRAVALAARQTSAAQVPLYLPALDPFTLPARAAPDFAEFDAEDARIEAGGLTIGDDADDDFY